MSLLLSCTPLSAITPPSESTSVWLPTRTKREKKKTPTRSLARKRLSLTPIVRSRSFRRQVPRCCSSMPLDAAVSSSQAHDSLLYSRAYWVSESTIAWNIDAGEGSCYLYASKTASLSVTNYGIQGYDVRLKLEVDNTGLLENVKEKFPHIRDYRAFKVPSTLDVRSLLKWQLAVALYTSDGQWDTATGLQLPGVLDDLFSYDGPLGAVFSKEAVSLHLWAPTAQVVRCCIYKDPSGEDPVEIVPLQEFNGVWSATGPRRWEGLYYVYEVYVYHPSTLRIERCIANDPYARGVSGLAYAHLD